MRAREADPVDSLNGIAGPQQLGEVAADVAPVGVHVLAEQRELAHSFARKTLDLREDLAGPPRDLAAPDGRDDAVRADGVAAHRDLHPGLEASLAMPRQAARE